MVRTRMIAKSWVADSPDQHEAESGPVVRGWRCSAGPIGVTVNGTDPCRTAGAWVRGR